MKLLFVILFAVGLPAGASSVPTFTRGTMTSTTTSYQTMTETYNIVEYSTGNSYTMTGTNITVQGKPGVGASYSQTVPGLPTQFSETRLTPGISRVTNFTRTTTIDSTTQSLSVFTQ